MAGYSQWVIAIFRAFSRPICIAAIRHAQRSNCLHRKPASTPAPAATSEAPRLTGATTPQASAHLRACPGQLNAPGLLISRPIAGRIRAARVPSCLGQLRVPNYSAYYCNTTTHPDQSQARAAAMNTGDSSNARPPRLDGCAVCCRERPAWPATQSRKACPMRQSRWKEQPRT